MSSLVGVWKHEMTYGGPSPMVTLQTIREDGSCETHMIYPMGGGCEQHIYHYGTVEIGENSLRIEFRSGKTEMIGCEDSSKNFALRDFTAAENSDARTLLAQEIPYKVEGDLLKTIVKSPIGEMTIVYQRQAE